MGLSCSDDRGVTTEDMTQQAAFWTLQQWYISQKKLHHCCPDTENDCVRYSAYMHAFPRYDACRMSKWTRKRINTLRSGTLLVCAAYVVSGDTRLLLLTQSWKQRSSLQAHFKAFSCCRKKCLFCGLNLPHRDRLDTSAGVVWPVCFWIIGWVSSCVSFLGVGWMMQPLIDITCLVYCSMGLNDKTGKRRWGLYG